MVKGLRQINLPEWKRAMNFQKIERIAIVTIGTRINLVAIAVANWDKASWTFEQWSETATWQADLMAGAIEGALVIFTYILAQRLMANAKRLKSDPEQPTKVLWAFVIFLCAVSAFCNALYFVRFGILSDPLGNFWANVTAGIVLGLAAPVLASGIAYLQGEETATEIAMEEAQQKRDEENERRRQRREEEKMLAAQQTVVDMKEQVGEFSNWITSKERSEMIVRCIRHLDPQQKGVTRKQIWELVFNGHSESDSTKYQTIKDLLKNEENTTGPLKKVGGLITWVENQESVQTEGEN